MQGLGYCIEMLVDMEVDLPRDVRAAERATACATNSEGGDGQPHQAPAAEAVPARQGHRPAQRAQAARALQHGVQGQAVAELTLDPELQEIAPFWPRLQARDVHPCCPSLQRYSVAEAHMEVVLLGRDAAYTRQFVADLWHCRQLRAARVAAPVAAARHVVASGLPHSPCWQVCQMP